MPPGPLLALDTASLYYRAYYALPESMTAPDGHPNNAVRGLLDTVTRLVSAHSPSLVAACWDVDWRPSWRVDRLPSYKTHRLLESAEADDAAGEEVPDTLGPQIGAIAQLLDALGIPRPGAEGFEADDVIATLAEHHGDRDGGVIVVTGDRDLVQVVRPGVRLLLTVNGGMDRWPLLDAGAVVDRFGVRPQQYVDLAVLRGDPSDGIPGVPGFGAKTAASVLGAYGTLDAAVGAACQGRAERPLTPRLAGLLAEHRELIEDMRFVATARTDVPVGRVQRAPVDATALDALAEEWGVARQVESLRTALDAIGA